MSTCQSQQPRVIHVKPLAATASISTNDRYISSVTTGGQSDVTSTLEWFRERFNRIAADDGTISKDELAYTAKYYEGFGENLFQLIDIDYNGCITLAEFMGGINRLTSKDRHARILSWFEATFKRACGNDNLMTMEQFTDALHIKGFAERLFQLMDSDNTGRITVQCVLDAFGKLKSLDTDGKWLAWLEQRFKEFAGSDRLITFKNFQKAFNLNDNSFLAERLFQLLDEDNSGTISLTEIHNGLSVFQYGSDTEKLHFLFRIYDMNGNGCIEFNELKTVLKSCVKESALKLSDIQLDELTRALFDDADSDQSGFITFDELQCELEKHPGIIENLSLSASNWFQPKPSKRKSKKSRNLCPSWMSLKYFINNWSYVIFIAVYITLNIVLFVEAAVKYRDKGVFVSIARGCGQCLNFNPVVALVLMLRQCLTILRSTPLAHFLPLDHHIELHKLTAYFIFTFSIIHCFAHLCNFTWLEINNDSLLNTTTVWEYLFSVDTSIGWVGGAAGLTGWILIIILSIIFIFALPCVRRKGFFELFYWTHNLFFVWYIALILHGPHFWKWFIFPAVVYIIEWISRLKIVKLARYGRTYIQEGLILPSDVVHLVINRPSNFTFQPGDYVFVNIPAIAKYEWHPFTVSSAPEQQGSIWLHIRSVGTWTTRLYTYFKRQHENSKRNLISIKIPKEPISSHKSRGVSINSIYPSLDDSDIRHPLEPCEDTLDNMSNTVGQHSNNNTSIGDKAFSVVISKPAVINVQANDNKHNKTEIFIDGPYGAPSVHIFQAEHAVLIGAGIGVTPFASILQSVIIRYRNAKQVCPRCNHGWTSEIPSSVMRVKKVDFFWINRHQRSFEWFVSLLSQLEMEQSEQDSFENFLEMHMYMTSALGRNDIKAIGLQMALDLIHKKKNRDIITGLRTRTQAGRPDWDKVFTKLKKNKKGKVTVFFCGAPALSRTLKQKCAKYGFNFRKENF